LPAVSLIWSHLPAMAAMLKDSEKNALQVKHNREPKINCVWFGHTTEAQAENSFCLTHPPSTLPLNAWKCPKRATEEGASASASLRLAKVTLTLPP
jgi:hypothetical protein